MACPQRGVPADEARLMRPLRAPHSSRSAELSHSQKLLSCGANQGATREKGTFSGIPLKTRDSRTPRTHVRVHRRRRCRIASQTPQGSPRLVRVTRRMPAIFGAKYRKEAAVGSFCCTSRRYCQLSLVAEAPLVSTTSAVMKRYPSLADIVVIGGDCRRQRGLFSGAARPVLIIAV